MLSKPNQHSGPVMAVRLAVLSPDPNSRPPELKCSIKVKPSKKLEDSSVQIFSGYTSLDSGGCNSSKRECSVWQPSKTWAKYFHHTQPDLYFGKEFDKAESSNATSARDDDQIHAHKYFC